jgi:hypothetical protein
MYNSNKARKTREIRLIRIAAGCACGLGLLNSAIALPPLGRGNSSRSTAESARSISVVGRSFAPQVPKAAAPLDLRLPQDSGSAGVHGGAGALASAPFPSAIHHLDFGKTDPGRADLGTEDRGADERVRPPPLGADAVNFQKMSRAEIIARRIHREGLPIARVWESKSAVLSIGLNQRGKPGLWFTQRMQ